MILHLRQVDTLEAAGLVDTLVAAGLVDTREAAGLVDAPEAAGMVDTPEAAGLVELCLLPLRFVHWDFSELFAYAWVHAAKWG